jgi:putative transposase
MYHLVLPAKYRKTIFSTEVDEELKNICLEIQDKYEIIFLEIGTDKDHVHLLVQSVPNLSVTQIVTTIKSITAKQLFLRRPQMKKLLWGGHVWTSGFFSNTVSKNGGEKAIANYVKHQGTDKGYKKLFQQSYSEVLF